MRRTPCTPHPQPPESPRKRKRGRPAAPHRGRLESVDSLSHPHIPRAREPATTPRAASTAPPSPPPLPAFQLLLGPHGSGAGPAVELLDTKDPPARRVCSSAPPRTRSSDPRHHLPASQAPRLPASRYGARTAASMSQKRFVQGSLTPTDIAAARATEAAAPRRSSFLPTRATSRIPPRVTTAESGMLTGGRE